MGVGERHSHHGESFQTDATESLELTVEFCRGQCLYASTEAGTHELEHLSQSLTDPSIAQCLVSDLGSKDLSMRRITGLELEFTPSNISDDHIELFDLFIPQTGPIAPTPR